VEPFLVMAGLQSTKMATVLEQILSSNKKLGIWNYAQSK
jgi:hypothetical protein